HCMSLHSLPPLWRIITGMLGEVSGATLKRGVYLGRSRSRFQRTLISLNSNVAVKRPHTLKAPLCCAGGGVSGQRSVAYFGSVQYPDCKTCTPYPPSTQRGST